MRSIIESPIQEKKEEKKNKTEKEARGELSDLPGEIDAYFSKLPKNLQYEILKGISNIEEKAGDKISAKEEKIIKQIEYFDAFLDMLLISVKTGEYFEDLEENKLKPEVKRFLNTIWNNRGKVDDNVLDPVEKRSFFGMGEYEVPRSREKDVGRVDLFGQELHDKLSKERERLTDEYNKKKEEYDKAKKMLKIAEGKKREWRKWNKIVWEKRHEFEKPEEELRVFDLTHTKNKEKEELEYTEKASKVAEWLDPDEFAIGVGASIEQSLSFFNTVLKGSDLKNLEKDELKDLGVETWKDIDFENLKELGFKTRKEVEKNPKLKKEYKGYYLENVLAAVRAMKNVEEAVNEWYEEHQNEEKMRELTKKKEKRERVLKDPGRVGEIPQKQQLLIDHFQALFKSFLRGKSEGKADEDLGAEIRHMENALNILNLRSKR